MAFPIYWLREDSLAFPDPRQASPEGILAAGGDLSQARLLAAYRQGIFPWYSAGDPILWWSPDPRFVLWPEDLRVSKSMRPYFNQRKFHVTFDHDFAAVMRACAATPRAGQYGTWITPEMLTAYAELHRAGYAHSVEVWRDEELVGGLYGLALGKVFFGESMFTRVSNASKFGFISLVRWLTAKGYQLIDCQQETGHLARLGAHAMPRTEFLGYLQQWAQPPYAPRSWREEEVGL
jgi:leucyl/phenylalanyl-tRNA--protein transferase